MLDAFIQLSKILTDERELNRQLAEEYLKRIEGGMLGANLPALLKEFQAIRASGGNQVEEVGRRLIKSKFK